mmetsp:Transcript_13172/g.48870  ORF Transcript_13172/g.48870 Transcript_13172/m.48870 type:complete len:109 (-) Transcript_13172:228-554(-)
MHPDQAAGDIVDFAIQRRIPFAITPCCVYGNSFPRRKTSDGVPVRSYQQLCQWLLEKHPAIRRRVLDFEGKNVCIYMPKDGYETPDLKGDDALPPSDSLDKETHQYEP